MAIVDLKREDVETNITDSVDFKFSESASAKLMGMMSDFLYSDKEYAVISELCSNAYDIHKQVGKGDVPIKVNLPTSLDPHFTVRDYGTGLAEQEVYNLLASYGESTKSDTNDAIGFWGIGSKSPASVTDNWTIISYWNNTKAHYEVFIGDKGIPTIKKIFQMRTDEPAGLEVVVPVKKENYHDWTQAAQKAFRHYDVRPKVNIRSFVVDTPEILFDMGSWFITKFESYRYSNKPKIVTTLREYEVDLAKVLDQDTRVEIGTFGNIYMRFPVGEIDLSISREQIQYNKKTIENIRRRVLEIRDTIKKEFTDLYSITVEIEYRTRLADVFNKYNGVYPNHSISNYVDGKFGINKIPYDLMYVTEKLSHPKESWKDVYDGISRALGTKKSIVDTRTQFEYDNGVRHSFTTATIPIERRNDVIFVLDDCPGAVARVRYSGDPTKHYIVGKVPVFAGYVEQKKASEFDPRPRVKRVQTVEEKCSHYYTLDGQRVLKLHVEEYEELLKEKDKVGYKKIVNARSGYDMAELYRIKENCRVLDLKMVLFNGQDSEFEEIGSLMRKKVDQMKDDTRVRGELRKHLLSSLQSSLWMYSTPYTTQVLDIVDGTKLEKYAILKEVCESAGSVEGNRYQLLFDEFGIKYEVPVAKEMIKEFYQALDKYPLLRYYRSSNEKEFRDYVLMIDKQGETE